MRFVYILGLLSWVSTSTNAINSNQERDLGYGTKELVDELLRISYPLTTATEVTISSIQSLQPAIILTQVEVDFIVLLFSLKRLEVEILPYLLEVLINNGTLLSSLQSGKGQGGRGVGNLPDASTLGGITAN